MRALNPFPIILFLTLEFDDGTKETQYYVHYEDRDRRLDEWIPLNRILKTIPVQSKNIKTPAAKKDMLPMTRSQRRIQEEFGHMHVGINTMDATTAKLEKQHEEVSVYLFLLIFSIIQTLEEDLNHLHSLGQVFL